MGSGGENVAFPLVVWATGELQAFPASNIITHRQRNKFAQNNFEIPGLLPKKREFLFNNRFY